MKFLKNIGANAVSGGIAVGGGCASRVVANKVLPMIPMVKDHPKFHGGINFLIGALIADVKAVHYGGVGYMAVSGTDMVSNFVPMLQPKVQTVSGLEGLAEELADELEERLNDDVSNANAALNGDVDNNVMNGAEDDDDSVGGPVDVAMADGEDD